MRLAQFASDVQSARQVLLVLQTYAPQVVATDWMHMPLPEQNDAGCNIDPLHDAARPHDTLAAASWQPPAPLQAPVLPHGGAAAHCPDGARVSAGMFAHTPALPDRLHTWHVPQLGLPQQTPSTQLPLMHWLATVHCTPFGFSAQLRLGAVP